MWKIFLLCYQKISAQKAKAAVHFPEQDNRCEDFTIVIAIVLGEEYSRYKLLQAFEYNQREMLLGSFTRFRHFELLEDGMDLQIEVDSSRKMEMCSDSRVEILRVYGPDRCLVTGMRPLIRRYPPD